MLTIQLHGHLQTFSNKPLEVEVATMPQLISYLLRAFPAIRQVLKDGVFRVALDNEKASRLLSSHNVQNARLEGVRVVHLVPVEGIAGRKAMAIIGIVVGVALIATGVFAIHGAMVAGASFGAAAGTVVFAGVTASAMILTGASLAITSGMALASMRGLGDLMDTERPEERQSTLFSQVTNRTAKGASLPVCYGRFLCGSNVVSQSIRTVEVLG